LLQHLKQKENVLMMFDKLVCLFNQLQHDYNTTTVWGWISPAHLDSLGKKYIDICFLSRFEFGFSPVS